MDTESQSFIVNDWVIFNSPDAPETSFAGKMHGHRARVVAVYPNEPYRYRIKFTNEKYLTVRPAQLSTPPER